MKVVILAGGLGTRISEESEFKPKPMIEIGGMPMLWHIMKIYSFYNYNDFIICAGYKQHIIKEWFADYFLHTSDITFDYTAGKNEIIVHNKHIEPWKVTIVDTGLHTMTGGRMKKIQEYIGNETFMLTYGDGVADVNIHELIAFHKNHGRIATISMYNFAQSKGVVKVGKDGMIDEFREKSDTSGDLINIGFMVLQPSVFECIHTDEPFEYEPMNRLAESKQLAGYTHTGYWQCMDTLREKQKIEELWDSGKAPWKLWGGGNMNLDFFKGKKVLLTGHTGFKGSWMSTMLSNAGAEVIGYSSCSKTRTRLFDLCGVKNQITHIKGDIRDLGHLLSVCQECNPEIVIHMAAQPLVRFSYENPLDTYSINVMGTVNICEAVRQTESVRSFLNVTTDKVYENKEWEWGYRENEPLDGYDPYSNSKSCSELVTHSYKNSFFSDGCVAVSTVRAGNVIGGGDFAKDRIIPDCVRAAVENREIAVRNPYSVRPYQHVMEPLYAYLMIVEKQYEDGKYAGCYNVGPDDRDCMQTGILVDLFCRYWGDDLKWVDKHDGGFHEANFLKLDCSKLKATFGWRPRWNLEKAVEKTVEWSKAWARGEDVRLIMDKQIEEFLQAEER